MSLPAWGEWIEIRSQYIRKGAPRQSLPAWGEWIEMAGKPARYQTPTSLSPHGESGLKSGTKERRFKEALSLPAWGEWIEMSLLYSC